MGAEPETRARIAIVDYGMGNLRSVEKALERAGAEPVITHSVGAIHDADGIVLPGVGAFPRAMARIQDLGLDLVISGRLRTGVPVLGICLGHQLVFEASTELGVSRGIGLFEGTVTSLEAPGLKVPHIGWEPVRWTLESELSAGIPDGTPFYFAHSFAPRPLHEEDVIGVAEHGGPFACAVARHPAYGVQFHPEKSSGAGLRLLANFARICASVPV
jgi:glutamine amidotransferase